MTSKQVKFLRKQDKIAITAYKNRSVKELLKCLNTLKTFEKYEKKIDNIVSTVLFNIISVCYADINEINQKEDKNYCIMKLRYQRMCIESYNSLSNEEYRLMHNNFNIDVGILILNYGAALNTTGRFLNAIYVYSKVESSSIVFPKALANIANCYGEYSKTKNMIYSKYLFELGYSFIIKAEENKNNIPEYEVYTEQIKNRFEFRGDIKNTYNYTKKDLSELSDFEKWCWENRLFISYEQDMLYEGLYDISDIQGPIQIIYKLVKNKDEINHSNSTKDFDKILSCFKTIKSNFLHYREQFFKIQSENYKNIDYGLCSMSNIDESIIFDSFSITLVEIFKSLYSIQDKIVYCVNIMLQIETDYSKIEKNKYWKSLEKKGYQNRYSRINSLLWCYIDYFNNEEINDTGYKYITINSLRNIFEHRNYYIYKTENYSKICSNENNDSVYISESEIIKMIYELLRVSREMIMYLILFIDEFNTLNYKKITSK